MGSAIRQDGGTASVVAHFIKALSLWDETVGPSHLRLRPDPRDSCVRPVLISSDEPAHWILNIASLTYS
jgi:hypothetical protein